jgi:hypothetical protein
MVSSSPVSEKNSLRIGKIVLDEMVKTQYNSISKIEKGK